MVAAARFRVLGLGALLVAIYAFALTCAVRGMPSEAVAVGLAVDLTITATAATWWLGVKSGMLSRRAPFVVFGIGAATVKWVLPFGASRLALGLAIGLEALAVAVIVVRVRRLVRSMRRDAELPVILRLANGLEEVGIPRVVARVLTTEIATFEAAVTGWFRRAPREGFSVHRTHCSIAMHVVIGGLIALETIVLHLLLARVTEVGAWISTGFSIYAVLWIIGDAHALRLGRIRVEREAVVIEIARRWAAVIPRRLIAGVHLETAVAEGTVNLAIETPTVAIELSEPVTVRGPFGLTRTGARLALTVDDAGGFVAALEVGARGV